MDEGSGYMTVQSWYRMVLSLSQNYSGSGSGQWSCVEIKCHCRHENHNWCDTIHNTHRPGEVNQCIPHNTCTHGWLLAEWNIIDDDVVHKRFHNQNHFWLWRTSDHRLSLPHIAISWFHDISKLWNSIWILRNCGRSKFPSPGAIVTTSSCVRHTVEMQCHAKCIFKPRSVINIFIRHISNLRCGVRKCIASHCIAFCNILCGITINSNGHRLSDLWLWQQWDSDLSHS